MKKLLLLGAQDTHLPLIRRAKERGVYVITCDYLPENPGHKLADEAYYDSTTDREAVLRLAERLGVDGIMTFSSDPAAPVAAWVAERLGLPGGGAEAVRIMSEKDAFRDFLRKHGFRVPRFSSYTSLDGLRGDLESLSFPLMVKPVDASGSKGVERVADADALLQCFEGALAYSRSGRVIVEECIDSDYPQLHGDGFVLGGELVFLQLGDHHFNPEVNNLVPISSTFPSGQPEEQVKRVEEEIRRFIRLVGYRQGAINVEARVSAGGEVYIIDIGARNGGNFTPQTIEYSTGFDFVDVGLSVALGEPLQIPSAVRRACYSHLVVHAAADGVLDGLEFSEMLREQIVEWHPCVEVGASVFAFRRANAAIGVLIVRSDSVRELNGVADGMDEHVRVYLR
ncbi:MAG: carbamoyl-phosphate-synthetase [Bacteroidetes bacterium]|nr:MAG: carbamoyl-phosphate-synthetase [Bacteroidota bacterium]